MPFDWAGAEALAAKFRSAASRLDAQIPRRNGYAADARDEWRGHYADRFDERIGIGTDDAAHIARAMRDAVRKLDELARLAREEQDRRIKAREWKARQHGGLLGAVEDVGHAIGIGKEEEPPPVDHGEGNTYTADPHMPGGRE